MSWKFQNSLPMCENANTSLLQCRILTMWFWFFSNLSFWKHTLPMCENANTSLLQCRMLTMWFWFFSTLSFWKHTHTRTQHSMPFIRRFNVEQCQITMAKQLAAFCALQSAKGKPATALSVSCVWRLKDFTTSSRRKSQNLECAQNTQCFYTYQVSPFSSGSLINCAISFFWVSKSGAPPSAMFVYFQFLEVLLMVSIYRTMTLLVRHSSGAVWESRWTSWAVRPNEPSGFRGRKDILNHASALVTTCP